MGIPAVAVGATEPEVRTAAGKLRGREGNPPNYPDLVDLLVAVGRDPVAGRAARAELPLLSRRSPCCRPAASGRDARVRPDELHQLVMPTLVVWGERDPVGSVAVAQAVTEMIPHARLEVLPTGCGPFLGQLARTTAAVEDFVR